MFYGPSCQTQQCSVYEMVHPTTTNNTTIVFYKCIEHSINDQKRSFITNPHYYTSKSKVYGPTLEYNCNPAYDLSHIKIKLVSEDIIQGFEQNGA